MQPSSGPGTAFTAPPWREWALPVCLVLSGAAAAALNGRELVFGLRPSLGGVAGSAAYVAVWLGFAFESGWRRDCRRLRRMAVFWAVVVAGTAVCSTLLRQNLGSGTALPGGWLAPALLLVVTAPLYGLSWFCDADVPTVLVSVALGGAVLTLALAAAARLLRPAAWRAGGVASSE